VLCGRGRHPAARGGRQTGCHRPGVRCAQRPHDGGIRLRITFRRPDCPGGRQERHAGHPVGTKASRAERQLLGTAWQTGFDRSLGDFSAGRFRDPLGFARQPARCRLRGAWWTSCHAPSGHAALFAVRTQRRLVRVSQSPTGPPPSAARHEFPDGDGSHRSLRHRRVVRGGHRCFLVRPLLVAGTLECRAGP